jgi:hypothetical protein
MSVFPQTACIIVGTNGFVWYAPKATEQDDYYTLTEARCIRQWGTDKGLAQLISGPTSATVLDAPSDVVLAKVAFLFAIPCSTWVV